jgi:hypothetical protein
VPEPTEESVEMVRSQLSALARRTAFGDRALARADPARLALAAPHDVYSLGLSDLAEEASFDKASLVGRRFIVMEGDKAIASAEVADQETGSAGFQATEGPYVESTAAAIEQAEGDSDLAGGDYEVRVLRIPALYVMALWLKDERGVADVLIPLDPTPATLEAGRKYAPAELGSVLAEAARARLAFHDEEDLPT